jgi:hypothetical protein
MSDGANVLRKGKLTYRYLTEFKAANDGEETQPQLLAEGTMAESHSHVTLPSRWS